MTATHAARATQSTTRRIVTRTEARGTRGIPRLLNQAANQALSTPSAAAMGAVILLRERLGLRRTTVEGPLTREAPSNGTLA